MAKLFDYVWELIEGPKAVNYSDPNLLMAKPKWLLQSTADIARHEGFREYAYPDPPSLLSRNYPAQKYKWGYRPAELILEEIGEPPYKGNPWTVGYGNTNDVTHHSHVTKEKDYKDLEVRVAHYAEGLNTLVPDWRTRPLFLQSVLIDMIYNLGKDGLGSFKNTLRLVREENYKEASANLEQSLYYRQTGARARENVERLRTQRIQPEYIV